MRVDGIELFDDAPAINFQVASGTTFPTEVDNVGELFYFTGGATAQLYIYSGTEWVAVVPATPTAPQVSSADIITALGYVPAALDSNTNTLAENQIPALSLINTFVVGSQAEMLQLTAQTGDVAIRTDVNKTYILQGNDPTVAAQWVQILAPNTSSTAVVATGPTFPSSPALGSIFYRTDLGSLYTFTNAGWKDTLQLTKSAGTDGVIEVQLGDGSGGFTSVPMAPAGRVLTSNGSQAPTWEEPAVSGGTVTSVAVSGGSTGLTTTGAITTNGTITLDGTLLIEHGGTGATSVSGIIQNILPNQANKGGAALVTDGFGNLSWTVQPGTVYSAGAGLQLDHTTFISTVADNTGAANHLQISNGDATLSNLAYGTAGSVLVSNGPGAAPSWSAQLGTVSQININTNPNMGLYIAGGDYVSPLSTKITTTGSIGLAGVLSILNGGTGATTVEGVRAIVLPDPGGAAGAFLTSGGSYNSLRWGDPFPSQAGNAGMFLTTNGTNIGWGIPVGGGTVVSVDATGGTTGLSFTGGPISTSGTLTLGGILGIANGGTGTTNANDALNSFLPAQGIANAGKILTTDGTNTHWTTASAGSVTYVNADGGATGLGFSGGPITESGTFILNGVLNVASGGTGTTSLHSLITSLLPNQAGYNGYVLSTDGTGNLSWITQTAVTSITAGSGINISAASGPVTITNTGVLSVAMSGGTTGMSFAGGPITSTGTLTLTGVLGLANGGTGATSAIGALNKLLPAQAGNAGLVLSTDGTNALWAPASAGTVMSVDIDPGVTGLTFAGGPITSTGTFSVGGHLSIISGGTGATSAKDARNNLMPTQASKTGFILTTDGTDMSWINPASISGIANGTTGSIQFNTSGALNGSSNFSWDNTNNQMTITRPGGGVVAQLRSQSGTQSSLLSFGRAVANEALVGVYGNSSLPFTDAVQGDFVISTSSGNLLLGASTGAAVFKADNAGNLSLGQTGYTAIKAGGVEQFRVTATGALSIGASGTAYGTAGQVLTSNGDGAPTWATPSSVVAGTTGQIQWNSSGSLAGTSYITTDGATLNFGNVYSYTTPQLSTTSGNFYISVPTGSPSAANTFSFNGTGSTFTLPAAINVNSYTYGSTITSQANAGGAGYALRVVAPTGSGVGGNSGGHGYLELLGGGATSSWTAFAGVLNSSRRGGVNIQSGVSPAGTGTYNNGSMINIAAGNGTSDGTTIGTAGRITLTAGSTVDTASASVNGASITILGGSSTSSGGLSLSAGSSSSATIVGGDLALAAGFSSSTAGGKITLTTTNAGTSAVRLAILPTGDFQVNGTSGTSGQVLTSAGPGATPTWANVTAGVSVTANNTWTAAQRGAVSNLTSGSVITPSFDASNNFAVTVSANFTLANPSTTLVPGQSGMIEITQDSVGSRIISWGSLYVAAGGSKPVLSTTPNAVDLLSYYVTSTGKIFVTASLAVA